MDSLLRNRGFNSVPRSGLVKYIDLNMSTVMSVSECCEVSGGGEGRLECMI